MAKLSKTELLFIRACKVEDATKRVTSVYKRFYSRHHGTDCDVAAIMLNVVDKHYPINAIKLINELNPANAWRYANSGQTLTYHQLVLRVLICHIRLSDVRRIDGWVDPAWIRNRK